jgi:hypothetical protein
MKTRSSPFRVLIPCETVEGAASYWPGLENVEVTPEDAEAWRKATDEVKTIEAELQSTNATGCPRTPSPPRRP